MERFSHSLSRGRIYEFITNPFFLISVIFAVNVFATIDIPMTTDEGIWNYIGHSWVNHGISPYVGSVENKTPGIFYLHAIPNLLFGVNFWFSRVLAILSVAATSMVLYFIGKNLYSKLAGALAMFLFGVTMSWPLMGGFSPAHTETFMILFTVIAFFFIIRAREPEKRILNIFISGLSIGAAIAFKQVAILGLAGIAAYYLFSRKIHYKSAVYFFVILGGGVTFATFLSIIPLLLAGVSFYDYIDGAWLILLERGSSPLSLYERFLHFSKVWLSEMIIFYPFVALFILNRKKMLEAGIPFAGIVSLAFFDFLAVNASGFYFYHQLRQLIPSMALISGIVISSMLSAKNFTFKWSGLYDYFPHINKFSEAKLKTLAIIVIMVFWFLPFKILAMRYPEPATISLLKQNNKFGLFLKDNTRADDRVYIWGWHGTQIQAYSERASPSRYFNSIFIRKPGAEKELIGDLKARPPRFVLLPAKKYLESLGDSGFTLNIDEKNVPKELENIISRSYKYNFTAGIYDFYEIVDGYHIANNS